MRDAKKRVKELAEALKREPGSVPKRLELAAALREAGRPVEAIDLYRGVAEAYAEEGRLVQAIAVCKGILEIDPEHRDTLEMLADLASKRAARPKGEAELRKEGSRWVAHTGAHSHDEEETSASGDRWAAGLAEHTPRDHMPMWGSALYEEEEDIEVIPGVDDRTPTGPGALEPYPQAHETVVARKPSSAPRSVQEIEVEALGPAPGVEPPHEPAALLPPDEPVALAESHWTDTDKTPAPQALAPTPGLDFPPEVKKFARGDKLLGFASEGEAPPVRESTQVLTEAEKLPSPEELAQKYPSVAAEPDTSSTKAGTPRALEAGRPPAAPIEAFGKDESTLTWDDDADNQVLADALAAPFPRPALTRDPPPFPLLSDLPREAFMELLARMSVVRLGPGEMVLREGEAGDACYLIASGTLRVLKAGIDVAHLEPGAFFGEFAVLADQRRHASVETIDSVELLEIRRALLDELVAAHPGVARTLRTFYRERLMSTLLQTAPFFSQLSDEERKTIAERFRPRRFGRNAHIIDEGSAGGGLYLILVGEVVVVRGTKEEVFLGKLGEGSYFGEMSLLKGGVASATVRASRMTEVVQLPPRDFYEIVSQHPVLWEQLRSEAERREMANHALLTGEVQKNADGSVYLL